MLCCLSDICGMLQKPDCVLNRRFRVQLLATMSVTILPFAHGVGLGWLSPTLTQLQAANSPLPFPVGINEGSWIGAMFGLGGMAGTAMSAALLENLQRKTCIYIIAVPHTCLWILVYCAQNVAFLYFARFLAGLTGGAMYVIIPIFICEIADTDIRGTLSSMVMFAVCFGVLIGYILATYLSYHLVPLLALNLPIMYVVFACFFPETPQQLLRRKRFKDAEDSYNFYRSCWSETDIEIQRMHKQDFEELCAAIAKSSAQATLSFEEFLTKEALKSFCTGFVIVFANQLSGLFVFVNYMSSIFKESSSNIDPNVCTIIMGVMQILGCYGAVIFADRVGRKLLLLISIGGIVVGLVVFAAYNSFVHTEGFWVPLLTMAFVIVIGNMGLVALGFVIVVEIFPARIRAISVSFLFTFLCLLVFCTLKVFPILMYTYGISATMWACAGGSSMCFIYLVIFLPETKGKSMDAN